ncbi:MAG: precorrin-3B synthase [Xanthobacteraceae bacterium]
MPARRGACPGLSAPMPTGDGLLVRLLPIGTISLAAFAALCRAARRQGNGVIEITSRGSVQMRGLSNETTPQFAAEIAALDIAANDGVPILCNPLAGIDAEEILDSAALAAELRRALAVTTLAKKLGAKVSVAIDGGGAIGLAKLPADIRLTVDRDNGRSSLRIAVGGDEASAGLLGVVASSDAVIAATKLLEALAKRGPDARARDIVATEGVKPFRSAIADLLTSAHSRDSGNPALGPRFPADERSARGAIGARPLRGGSLACGVGLAFGHSDAAALERLVAIAEAAGASGFRTAPGRALLILGLAPRSASAFVAAAEHLGFVVRANDPRRNVVACAGAPICASAHIAARALAPRVAEQIAPYCGDGSTVHISGCAKGCAHAAPAALTMVGTLDGCALVADGSARDAPFALVTSNELPEAIARFARERKWEVAHG